jgi:hypothetical protein
LGYYYVPIERQGASRVVSSIVTWRDGGDRGRGRGRGQSRGRRRLGRKPAVVLLLAGLVAVGACGSGTVSVKATGSAARDQRTTASDAPAAPAPDAGIPHAARVGGPPLLPAPPAPAALPVDPGAGSLGQTTAFPGTTTTSFHHAIYDLWLAVTTGNVGYARPAFFPEAAYVQVKAIADPESDWQDRLWYDFTLDVAAAHALVGHGATFVRVIVPAADAAWVDPGACYNGVGYWHVPGSRVVYEEGGETRSFGIASLISWRGEWYVVHFGAVLRSGAYGEVDDPETGQGTPGPPGGC